MTAFFKLCTAFSSGTGLCLAHYSIFCLLLEAPRHGRCHALEIEFIWSIQWTLVITRSLGPEKYARYNETLLYQSYKNNTIQRKFTIWDHKNYLVIMKPHYISARYNESPLYFDNDAHTYHNFMVS